MLPSLFEDIAKNFASKIIPPVQRYFTYFFILVGILWLGGANYYYYAEDCEKFKGALITGFVFFALAIMTALWEYIVKKKKVVKNNTDSNFELVAKAAPIVLPLVYNIFTKIILKPRMLKTLVMIGFVGTSLYYLLQSQKNKSDP